MTMSIETPNKPKKPLPPPRNGVDTPAWRSERWDSLRTLTPRRQSRLPGLRVAHEDPDGFMTMPELTRLLEGYAASIGAPVETGCEVRSVVSHGAGFLVRTTRGEWLADVVVVATGHCDVPFVPGFAASLPRGVKQLTASSYRRPGDLPEGAVLVVGAAASGVQIAEEVQASGRHCPVPESCPRRTFATSPPSRTGCFASWAPTSSGCTATSPATRSTASTTRRTRRSSASTRAAGASPQTA